MFKIVTISRRDYRPINLMILLPIRYLVTINFVDLVIQANIIMIIQT
jgi:hypothetical protein